MPLEDWLPDLQGFPRDGIQVFLTADNTFLAAVIIDGVRTDLPEVGAGPYDAVLTPDQARRDTFELRIDNGRLTFGMPGYDITWIDTELPDLSWDQGVVQFGHHSYNPEKAEENTGHAGTWHWDDVVINPVVPFTMIHTDTEFVGGGETPRTVEFESAAPDDAYLRFSGIGDNLEISTDGGDSGQTAEILPGSKPEVDESFRSYWTPIPAGTTSVLVRGDDWWGGEWRARDLTIWAPA